MTAIEEKCFSCTRGDCTWNGAVASCPYSVAAEQDAPPKGRKERTAAYHRTYYERNRERLIAYQRAYRTTHREEHNVYKRDRRAKKKTEQTESAPSATN